MIEASKGLVVIYVDVDKEGAFAQDWGIRSIPTVIFTDAEGSEIDRLGRRRSPAQVREVFEDIAGSYGS